jgi:ATP-dependent Clp protease, protease subunit
MQTRLSTPPPLPPTYPRPEQPPERPSRPAPPPLGFAAAATVVQPVPEPDRTVELLLAERIVHVAGELDDAAADRVVARLLLLAAQDQRRPITCYVGAPSGSATAALAVHDAMRLVEPEITTWAVGLVGAAGALLLAAGAPGHRHATPHARVRLGGIGRLGPVDVADDVTRLTATHAGRTLDELAATRDRWITADQARTLGIVDEVAP